MTNEQKLIKNKVGLIALAKDLSNVSRACKVLGFSRDTFYRWKDAYNEGGEEGLKELTRRKPNLKNRVPEATERAVLEMAIEQPAWGQVRVSNELRKSGVIISAQGVRSIWLRHDLQTFKHRLKALEEKSGKEGIVFTESQIVALERGREQEEACGEIDTQHPGYLGSQDTFYVGTLKGVGRIYQQTFVDTYSKVAQCKLYPMKTALTAADMLNDQVLPFFEEQGISLQRILTDRGSEYCGKADEHEYQLYLPMMDIDHSTTKARSPQTNGICERFHKTILQEFYQVAFRKKIYDTIDALQHDLDVWLKYYNEVRTHQGKQCCGRTPMQTLLDAKSIVDEKTLHHHLRPSVEDAQMAQAV
jgi:transposase InsO family protein